MAIDFLNPLTDARYDRFITAHPDATIFHTPAWIRVLHETYGFTPGCVAIVDGDGLSGALPYMETRSITGKRRCVSLPFSDFCEPLFDGKDDFETIFEKFTGDAVARQWATIDIRGGQRFLANKPFYNEILTHDLDLTVDDDRLFQSFRDSTRRNIKKAHSSDVRITHETSLEATRTFYRLNCLTRKEHGIPPQPWLFFKLLWKYVLAAGYGFITLATCNGRAIAANFFLTFKTAGFYKYGAMDRKFDYLRPSNLAMWEGIRKCREFGCTKLSLGRTEMHHAGLLQFKRGFGCRETSIRYFSYHCGNNAFQKNTDSPIFQKVSLILFSRSPLPLLQLFGNLFYKYAG